MQTIAIAGASGFIGKNLIEYLLDNTDFNIRAMSRSDKKSDNPRLQWIKADLFSVLDIEKAIAGTELAVYLVHSMQPSAHLDQANFRDYDLILADNFGRACVKHNIKQVLYLGGLVPKKGKLSTHLASRLEVEKTILQYVPSSTIFRAAMVIGKGGSSFHILVNLVKRLPVMLCPQWTEMPTSPVHVDKVSEIFAKAIGQQRHFGKIYDLASTDEMSYYQLLQKTAQYLGLKRVMFKTKGFFIGLSRLWVSIFSGAPKSLVYPLLYSLKNEMVAAPDKKFPEDEVSSEPVEVGLEKAIENSGNKIYPFKTRTVDRKTVRSVQRSFLPKGMSAEGAAKEYMVWLPKALKPFMIVNVDGHYVRFHFLTPRITLLCLKWSPDRSEANRQLFYVKGGVLAAPQDRGRLEFREVLDSKCMLAAIHDFYPALPWYIYIYTQAIVHLFVMKLFGRHLRLVAEGKREWIQKS